MKRARTFLALSLTLGLALASTGAAAAPGCKLIQIADLPIRPESKLLAVDGAINGQKVGVVVDTGAQRSLILRSAAARLGLTLHEARGYGSMGVGGESKVEAALVEEFKIGEASRKNWRVLVVGEHDLGSDSAFLLGEDFFSQVDVEFDLAHNAIRLYQPKGCDGVPLAYWTTDHPGEAEIDAVGDNDPQIVLTVEINGTPLRAQLDSGATSSVLAKFDAARLGVTPETPGVVAARRAVGLGQRMVDTWIGPFESFAIGNEIIRDTTIGFADLWKDATYTSAGHIPRHPQGQPSMLLGADFLRAHRVLVAHSQRKIYFTYAGGPVFRRPAEAPETAPPKDETGEH